ncbi:MAG: hypothetical protein OEZ41_09935 [Nitrospirota bacterium]|nr:hypothetical protein [Nitrospirota bacterium]
MTALRLSLLVLLMVFFAQGCSVYTAFTHPSKVDIEGLENMKGVNRATVMNQCGVPISSSKNSDGGRTEIYKFYEGSSWAKGRGAFHLAADIFTLALWEIIAWPSELAARGDQLTAEAVYDNDDNLVSFKVLGRKPKELERVHQSGEAAEF